MAACGRQASSGKRTIYKCGDCGVSFATMELFVRHSCSIPSTCREDTGNGSSTMLCTGGLTIQATEESDHGGDCAGERENLPEDSSDNVSPGNLWSRAATLLLIAEYGKLKERQESGHIRKKQMWEKIAKELNEEGGYTFSGDQVAGRIKTLLRAYKNVKDHNNKSGNNVRKYEFQDELDELFASDPAVVPQEVRSSLKRSVEEEADSEETAETPGKDHSQKTKSKPKRSASSEVVELFKDYMSQQAEKEEQEAARREKRHQEKMAVLNNFIKAMSGTTDSTQ